MEGFDVTGFELAPLRRMRPSLWCSLLASSASTPAPGAIARCHCRRHVQESSIHGEIVIQEGTRSRDAHITGRVKHRRCQVKFPRISRRSEREPCGQGASKSCQTSMNDVREYAFLESRRAGPKNTSARDESSFPANPGGR